MTVYDRLASTDIGQRSLSRARLRHRVLEALHSSLAQSGLTKTEVANKLGIRKSAVSQVFGADGNFRVNTLADYFDALGCELEVQVVPKGTPRAKIAGTMPRLDLVWSEAKSMPPIEETGRVRPDAVRPWERDGVLADHG